MWQLSNLELIVIGTLNNSDYVSDLHGSRDAFSVAEDLVEIFCTQDVSERSLGEKSGGVMGVLHIGNRDRSI